MVKQKKKKAGRPKKAPTKVIRVPKAKSKLLKLLMADKDFWDKLDRMRGDYEPVKTIHPMP